MARALIVVLLALTLVSVSRVGRTVAQDAAAGDAPTAGGAGSAREAVDPLGNTPPVTGEELPAKPHEALTDPNPAPAEYLQLVEHALSEYNAAHYAEARGLMARAHALYPSARTLRGLGMVEFELRHYALSVGYLEQALASRVRALDGSLRSDVEALLVRAYGYVGRIKLEIRPITTSELSIDGIPAELPTDHTLLLDVGDHFLSIKAQNHSEARRAVSVFGGEVSTLHIDLKPAPREATREPLYKKWWLWTAAGVVAAGAATGITVGLLKNRDEQEPIEGNYPAAGTVQVLLGK